MYHRNEHAVKKCKIVACGGVALWETFQPVQAQKHGPQHNDDEAKINGFKKSSYSFMVRIFHDNK